MRDYCTREAPRLFPAILYRTANAVAWMSLKFEFDEKERFAVFDLPYQQSSIAEALASVARSIRVSAEAMLSHSYETGERSTNLANCEWIPEVAKITGPVWNLETADPSAKKKGDAWRNFGQIGNSLFHPMMAEDGTLGYLSLEKKQSIALVDCRVPPKTPLAIPPGPRMGVVQRA